MNWPRTPLRRLLLLLPIVSLLALGQAVDAAAASAPNVLRAPDPTGTTELYTTLASFDLSNPFFQSLGTNGRSCATCHQLTEGATVSAAGVQARFAASRGTDPIFRLVDGANAPTADVSTLSARAVAYSMLLSKGVIRVQMPIPAGAEFTLVAVDDPYQYASAEHLSLFRRPLPAANLSFLSAVMWDGRETVDPITTNLSDPATLAALEADLMHQANDATLGHAQAAVPLTPDQQRQIVAFELSLFSAQVTHSQTGSLQAGGANGGAVALSSQPFSIGVNDSFASGFNPSAFSLFNAWSGSSLASRAAIARGQALFNTKPITITGVGGLNDATGQSTIMGTCSLCHDTPNVGNHSKSVPLNIGIASAARRTPDMPLYTLTCAPGTTNIAATLSNGVATVQTTDPGRALITGKCADIGKFKGPILRGLAARAPYFHNGSAATLTDAVDFYNARFAIGLSSQETSDLVAFLQSL